MKIGRRYKETKTNKLRIFFIIILIIIMLIMSIKIYNDYKTKNNKSIKEIANDKSVAQGNERTERMEKLEELQKENSDIIGWLQIENSNINYPVLQCDDNEYYMTHTYNKEYSKDGSLFLDKDYNWDIPSTNLLIYGHNNIGSKEMFSELINYKDENYYKEHKKIRFTTNKEDSEYEIIAVFLSRVYYKSEKNVFRYYYFINANNEQEFNDYIENSKKNSLYNLDATAQYGDQLLTLSTCEYSQTDGRLAVVAKKIK